MPSIRRAVHPGSGPGGVRRDLDGGGPFLTDIERWIPWTFLVLHASLLAALALQAGTALPVMPAR